MFIELTRHSDGKKIKVSKHAIGYMEEVGMEKRRSIQER